MWNQLANLRENRENVENVEASSGMPRRFAVGLDGELSDFLGIEKTTQECTLSQRCFSILSAIDVLHAKEAVGESLEVRYMGGRGGLIYSLRMIS